MSGGCRTAVVLSFTIRHPQISPSLDEPRTSAGWAGLSIVGHVPTGVNPPILALGVFALHAL